MKKLYNKKEFFRTDWYYWKPGFESILKTLKTFILKLNKNEIIDVDFVKFYKLILKNIKGILKINNINFSKKIKNQINVLESYLISLGQNDFINLYLFLKAARNYTSHYWHESDKYKESYKRSIKQIENITDIFINSDSYSKEFQVTETRIFLLLYIISFDKNSILYKPNSFTNNITEINIIRNVQYNTEFPNIVSSALNLINQNFNFFKVKNFDSSFNYRINKNFISNILVPLLNLNSSSKKFATAHELNYSSNNEKIKNYSLEKFYYLDDKKVYEFSVRTFFKWYVNSFDNKSNFKPILDNENIDLNSFIKFATNKTKNNHNNKCLINFENLFDKERFSKSNINWKLNKTIKFFVRKNSKKTVFVFDERKIIDEDLKSIFSSKSNIKNTQLFLWLQKLLKKIKDKLDYKNKKEFLKIIDWSKNDGSWKNFSEIDSIFSKIFNNWEDNIRITCDSSIKNILSSNRNFLQFINYFITDKFKINESEFMIEKKFFLSKKEFADISRNINQIYWKSDNYVSEYYKELIKVLENKDYLKYFDIDLLKQITINDKLALEKLKEFYGFINNLENPKLETSGQKKIVFFEQYNNFKKEFKDENEFDFSIDKKFYKKNLEIFYIYFMLTGGKNNIKYLDSFKLLDSNITIKECKSSLVDNRKMFELSLNPYYNFLLKLLKYKYKNTKIELTYSEFKKEIEELNNNFKSVLKELFLLEEKIIDKNPNENDSYIKKGYLNFREVLSILKNDPDKYKKSILFSEYNRIFKNKKDHVDFLKDIKIIRNNIMHYCENFNDKKDEFILELICNFNKK